MSENLRVLTWTNKKTGAAHMVRPDKADREFASKVLAATQSAGAGFEDLVFRQICVKEGVRKLRACWGNKPTDGPLLARIAGYRLYGVLDVRERNEGPMSVSEAIGWALAEEGDVDPDRDIQSLERCYRKNRDALELAERMEKEDAIRRLADAMRRRGLTA